MATVDKLLIELALDNKKLVSSLQQSQVSIQRFANSARGILTNVAEALAALGIADFAKDLTTSFASMGVALTNGSKDTGTSIGKLQDWEQAAKRVGGTAQGVQTSMANFYSKMNQARLKGDGGLMSGLLQHLGVSATDKNGNLRKTNDIMLDLADSFKKMPQNDRYAIGNQLGLDNRTIDLMSEGKVQLSALLTQMSKHRVMTDEQAKKAMILNAQIADMNQRWEQSKTVLGEKLMPVAIDLINKFIIPAINFIPKLIKGFDDFSHTMGMSGTHMGELIIALMAFTKIAGMIRGIALAFGILDAAALPVLAPIAAIAAALGAVALAYEAIKNPAQTKKFFMGALHGAERVGKPVNDYMNKHFPGMGINNIAGNLSKVLGLGPLATAQMMQESSGVNQIGYKYQTQNGHLVRNMFGQAQFAKDAQGNKIPEAYGRFQVKPSSASAAMGRNITGAQILASPTLQKQIYDKMWAQSMKASGGDVKGALAYYNGGASDLAYYKKTGQTKNQYGEMITAEAAQLQANQMMAKNTQKDIAPQANQIKSQQLMARNAMPKTTSAMSSVANTNTNNNKSIHVANMHVHDVQSPHEFANNLMDMGAGHDSWAFSHGRLV
jgi:hypothetical protein